MRHSPQWVKIHMSFSGISMGQTSEMQSMLDESIFQMCSFYLIYMMTSSNRILFRVTDPLCGNSPITGEFPAQRPITRNFHVFFDLCLNKRLSEQSWCWWFETPSHPLWRHCSMLSFSQSPTLKHINPGDGTLLTWCLINHQLQLTIFYGV